MEIYSITENLEEDYDDNELIEALADVLMDRQEKVNNSLLTQKNGFTLLEKRRLPGEKPRLGKSQIIIPSLISSLTTSTPKINNDTTLIKLIPHSLYYQHYTLYTVNIFQRNLGSFYGKVCTNYFNF